MNQDMTEQHIKQGEIVMYQPDETIRLEVRLENDTVWLNRQQLAELFGRDVKTIGKHINNALKEELRKISTVAKFAIVQMEGGRKVARTIDMSQDMSTKYRCKKQVTRLMAGFSQFLAILMSKLRSSLGAAWEQPGVWLEAAWSMARVCLQYAYATPTVCLETKNLFPYGEQNIPTLGTKHSQPGNKTGFLRPFSSKRAELERRLLMSMLLMLVLGSSSVWAQTDYSGTYYIASDYQTTNPTTRNYNLEDLTKNFYLCPTENWISFGASGATKDTWTTGDDKPFLTTYKINAHDDYDNTKAKWTIEYSTTDNGTDYYYIKHSSGKYLVLNKQIDGAEGTNNHLRIRVHLESLTSSDLENEATRNNALFAITRDGRSYIIDPKTQSTYYFTVNKGNGDFLQGEDRNSAGTIGSGADKKGLAGTIGIYLGKTDDNRYFYLEEIFDRPTFTSTSSQIIINHSAGDNATIYYTIDGTNPTTTNHAGSGAAPLQIDMPDNNVTLKAIAVIDDLPSCISSIRVVPNPIITLAANEYTYDGSAKEPTVSSVMDGETPIATSKYTVTYSDKINAGTATVNVEDIAGDDLIVYGSKSFTINKKDLTITAKPKTITYGDEPTNDGVTYNSFAPGEDENVLEGTLAYAYEYAQYDNAGDYTITPSGLTGANYDISFVQGTLTVEQKEVGLTWSETTSFPYDGTSHGLTATATGMVNSDEIGVTVTGAQINGGNHTATASELTGTKAGNYKLPNENTHAFTIIPAELTVTANNQTITYGDAPAGNGVTCEGFVGEETSAVLGGTLAYDFSYTQYGDVGNNYTIMPKGLTSSNYEITFKKGKLTVSPKEVGLTWSETTSFPYDGTSHVLTATATGLVNGDVIGVKVTGAQTNAGSHTATASGLTGEKAGNYQLPEDKTQVFTISPKSIGDGTTPADGITVGIDESNNNIIVTGLTEDDYTITESTDEDGNQVWTITGTGNYGGSVKVMRISLVFYNTGVAANPGVVENVEDVAPFQAPANMNTTGKDVYIVTGVNLTKQEVKLKKISYAPKDIPVLLLDDLTGIHDTETGALNNSFTASPINVAEGDEADTSKNILKQVTEGEGLEVGFAQVFMFYQGKFLLTTNGTMPKGKFYFDNPYPPGSQTAFGARLLKIVIDDTTGMEDARSQTEEERSTRWYTLDGRSLSGKPTKKGLYLWNGRLVVIK